MDGSFLTPPATPEILKVYPRRLNPQSQAHYPYALLVTVTNVLSGQPVWAKLQDHRGSERRALLDCLDEGRRVGPGDILLLDRGFEGTEYWQAMDERDLFFVARLRAQGNLKREMSAFLRSKAAEKIVKLKQETRQGLTHEVTVRLLRGKKDRLGAPLLLVTNLLDRAKYPRRALIELYLKRWAIETMYFQVKELFRLERFHSKTVNGVLQEIYAQLVILSLTALLVQEARLQQKKLNPLRLANFKGAAEVVRRNFPTWIWRERSRRGSRIFALFLFAQVNRLVCVRQPGRSSPRISKQPAQSWHRGRKDRPKLKRERLAAEKRAMKRRAH